MKPANNCMCVDHLIRIRNFDDDLFNDVNSADMSNNLHSSHMNMLKHNVRVIDDKYFYI